MVEKSKVLGLLTEEHDRLVRAIAKKQRELKEFSQSCRGPLDSVDRAGLCSCQAELQSEFDRLSKLLKQYAHVIAHVEDEGAVCAECGADISARLMRKVPSKLCCAHATKAERREHDRRRTMRPHAFSA